MKTCLLNLMAATAVVAGLSACSSADDTFENYIKELENAECVPLYDTNNDWYVMVNTKGEITSERGFYRLGPLHSGLAWSMENDSALIGFVDAKGKYIIEPKYAAATTFSGGLAVAAEPNGLLSVIDTKGNVKFTLPADAYEVTAPISGIIGYTTLEGIQKLLTSKGKPLCAEPEIPEDDYLSINGKYFAYTSEMGDPEVIRISDGKPILQTVSFEKIIMSFDNPDDFMVCCDSKWGVINADGKFLINPSYKRMAMTGNMFMAMTDDDKLCWYDSKGEMVIKPKYKEVSKNFGYYDYAIVSVNGTNWTVIDRKGEQLFNKRFDEIVPAIDNHFFVKKDKKWGIVNSAGEFTVEPQFEQLSKLGRVLLASPGDKGATGVISLSGEYLTDRIFTGAGSGGDLGIYAVKPDAQAIASLAQKLARSIIIGQTIGSLPYTPTESAIYEYTEYCDGMLCLNDTKYYNGKVKIAIYSNFENGGISWRYSRGKYRPELVPADRVSLYCVTLDFSQNYELGEEVYKILSNQPGYKLEGKRPDKVDSFTIQCETPDEFKLYALDSANPTYYDEEY